MPSCPHTVKIEVEQDYFESSSNMTKFQSVRMPATEVVDVPHETVRCLYQEERILWR